MAKGMHLEIYPGGFERSVFCLGPFKSTTPINYFFMHNRALGLHCYFLSSFCGNEERSGAQAARDVPPEETVAVETREALHAGVMSAE